MVWTPVNWIPHRHYFTICAFERSIVRATAATTTTP